MNSPIGQVFVNPFGRPWILLSDLHEVKEILAHRRGEWDTAHFLADGLASFENFHGRFLTGPAFRANRQLTKELMGTRFLRDHGGLATFRASVELTRLFDAKAILAQGRPFCARQVMAYASLDVLAGLFFGENWAPTALGPQVKLLESKLKSEGATPDIWPGSLDQPVLFPPANPGELMGAVYETLGFVEMTFNALMSRLQHWLRSKQAWYKRPFEIKHRRVREQVATALRNVQSGQV